METSQLAPKPFSYAYFQDPPKWVRTLVALIAAILAFQGSLVAAIFVLGEEAEPSFVEVGEAIDKAGLSTNDAIREAQKPAPFHAADSRFRAAFPGVPTRSTERIDGSDIEITNYISESFEGTFVVATFPLAPDRPLNFDAAAAGSASNVEGAVQSKQMTTFQGLPAMDIVITFDGGVLRQLIVRASDRVIQLIVGTQTDDSAVYDSFKSSLTID